MIPLRDNIPHQRPPVTTSALIVVNALAFWYELHLPSARQETLFYVFGLVPARYTQPHWAHATGLWPRLPCSAGRT